MESKTVTVKRACTEGFWEIFVDDRPFCRDACFKHATVQPKAVFSYTVTVMDKDLWMGR